MRVPFFGKSLSFSVKVRIFLLALFCLAAEVQGQPDAGSPDQPTEDELPGGGGPGGPTGPNTDPTAVPIDGGAGWLLAAGAGYGIKKLRERRKKAGETQTSETEISEMESTLH